MVNTYYIVIEVYMLSHYHCSFIHTVYLMLCLDAIGRPRVARQVDIVVQRIQVLRLQIGSVHIDAFAIVSMVV